MDREQVKSLLEQSEWALKTGKRPELGIPEIATLCRMALAYLDATEWRPIETAPRKTEILLAWHDGTKWHQDTGWVEDWEPDLSPEQMRWMPLPSAPVLRAQREEDSISLKASTLLPGLYSTKIHQEGE